MDRTTTSDRTLAQTSQDLLNWVVAGLRWGAFWTASLLTFVWLPLLLLWDWIPIEVAGVVLAVHLVTLIVGHPHNASPETRTDGGEDADADHEH